MYGTIRIAGHCVFAWTHDGPKGAARTFTIEREHCPECVAELRRRWPAACFDGHVHGRPSARGTLRPSSEGIADELEPEPALALALVVDDSADDRALAARILGSLGYAVTTAGHGREALAVLRASVELPRFMILDLEMPVMNGGELLHRLGTDQRLATIPVVLVTGADTLPARGWTVALRKPVPPPLLLAIGSGYLAPR
jgi:CheY-like chemotaxis protein